MADEIYTIQIAYENVNFGEFNQAINNNVAAMVNIPATSSTSSNVGQSAVAAGILANSLSKVASSLGKINQVRRGRVWTPPKQTVVTSTIPEKNEVAKNVAAQMGVKKGYLKVMNTPSIQHPEFTPKQKAKISTWEESYVPRERERIRATAMEAEPFKIEAVHELDESSLKQMTLNRQHIGK